MTTETQFNANSENAQKSTGPKDTSKTRFNAIRHGLLAEKFFEYIPVEQKEMLTELQEIIKEEVGEPIGVLDWLAIQKFAIACWRLRKVNELEAIRTLKETDSCKDRDEFSKLLDNTFSESKKLSDDVLYPKLSEQDDLLMRYRAMTEKEYYRALEELKSRFQK